MLRLLLGLVPQLSGGQLAGEVAVLGLDPTRVPPRQMGAAGVGFLFQNPAEGFVADQVAEEVAFGPENLGLAVPEIELRVASSLAAVGLEGFHGRRLRQLSDGQRQRVAVAAALALEPRLLLLDEPTAHLDPATAREVLTVVMQACQERGTTLVLGEHRLGIVAPLVERVLVLAGGAVLADGPPRVVLAEPRLLNQGVPVPRATQAALTLGLGPPWPLTPQELAQKLLHQPRQPIPGAADSARHLPADGDRRGRAHGPDPSPPNRAAPGNQGPNAGHPRELTCDATPDRAGPATEPRPTRVQSQLVRQAVPDGADPGREPGEIVLEFQRVSYRYADSQGAAALADLSFTLAAGECMAVVGPSGAGKSTLARLALGLLRPDRGGVRLGGLPTDSTPVSDLAQVGGLVLQNPLLQLLASRVDDELRLGLGHLPMAEVERRVEEGLERFALASVRSRHPLALSEGQRRRVALAAVLVRQPRMLVLDEPTLGQDELQRVALASLIRSLAATGTAVLAISHDVELVNDACDSVLVLEGGRARTPLPLSLWSSPAELTAAGVPLADIPETAGRLTQAGWPVRARSVPDLASALR